VDEPTRICSKCNRALPLSNYYRRKDWGDGYRRDCKDCRKVADAASYQANRDARRAQQAIYRADPAQRQRQRERVARWRAEHPEWARATVRAYAARPENRELAKQRSRAWRIANPERKRELERRREALKLSGDAARISKGLLDAKLAYWGWRCWIAGPGCTVEPEQWDHVKPLSKGGTHLLANLRPACKTCNNSKKARWPLAVVLAWRAAI
jgi:5-methylcytosine-specific restriction endonuclease McrA